MIRILFFSFVTLTASGIKAQTRTYNWAVNGNQSGNFCSTRDVIADADGNTYLLVRYSEPVQFGAITLPSAGGNDIGVVKFNAAGVVQWATGAGGVNDEDAAGIALGLSGSIYVAGWFNQTATFGAEVITTDTPTGAGSRHEFFVAALNVSGQWSWARKQTGSANSEATSIATDPSGNVIVGGGFNSADLKIGGTTLPFQENLPFIAKYNSAGSFQWLKGASTEFGATLDGIATDNIGNVFIAGSFGTIEIDQVTLQIGQIVLTNVGDLDAGLTTSDLYVAALSPQGDVIWAKNAGSLAYETFARSIVVDASGKIYVSGTFQTSLDAGALNLTVIGPEGDADGFIVLLEDDGTWQWAVKTGSEIANSAPSLEIASDDHIYVYGSLDNSTINFGAFALNSAVGVNSYFARVNPDGSFRWGEAHPSIVAMAALAANKFRVSGAFSGELSLGTYTLTSTGSNGSNDVYVASLEYGPQVPDAIALTAVYNEVLLFPVPSVSEQILSVSGATIQEVILSDLAGRQINCSIVKNESNAVIAFPSDLAPGFYIYTVVTSTGKFSLKTQKGL